MFRDTDVPSDPNMRLILTLLTLSFPLYATNSVHLVDTYPPNTKGSQTFTNLSDEFIRCQISTRVDPDLPIGQLAEIRNITLAPYLSYTHHREGYKIIICEVVNASESE